MATEEWYRNTDWNSNIAADFEARLKRSKGSYHKAQYLRIQAYYLLETSKKELQVVGVRLMELLLKDYPTEEFSTILGHEQLGDYFFKLGDFERAESHFVIVTKHYQSKKSRGGTSGIADLKLAKTYLTANKADKFEEAYNIGKKFPLTELNFNNEKFYYTELMAHVCVKLEKQDEAKEFARSAIELSKITEPQFFRHKLLGIVKAADKQMLALRQIAKG